MIAIRQMQRADVAAVTRTHVAAFPNFFLTFLGAPFLRQLYRGIVDDGSGISYVAELDGKIIGFVAGTDTPARFYSRLLEKRLIHFALASIWPILRRPTILGRLLRAFTKGKEAPAAATARSELMSLAVLPTVRGGGAGRQLVEAFMVEAKRRGAALVFLTTDARDNDSVNRFYENLRFRRTRQFSTPEGRLMYEYERTCDV
jgi:ribosomal protein S18 acetylase RimI-like enzyme